ncbi:phosphotransferase [Streptomyces sp. NPDC051940]|uniref:phosphotransferase n=1 Tax=Streptomyces sp. NPDC051940 TaxID=3155675 RepID=UPI0034120FA2
MSESVLPGGSVNRVLRVGDTVRRTPQDRAGFVHELLRLLERRGFRAAPRFLGVDAEGREILSYVEGRAQWEPRPALSDDSVARVAELVRGFHDLTAGSALAGGSPVVCHNDLAPRNTVYDADGVPVALIDWDLAAPGERLHDVAHVCWQYLGLGPALADADAAGRRMRLVADAYGMAPGVRGALYGAVLWWQDRCRRGIAAGAEAGDPAMVRLRAAGAVGEVAAAHDWTVAHRAELTAAL